SSRRRHTRLQGDWSSDVCSSDLVAEMMAGGPVKTRWGVTQSMDDGVFERMLRVHLFGTFHCTREALKVMEEKGSGRVVNISSVRSEERRVGKECRCRWWADDEIK